jgi:hypothetical protein
MKIVINSVSENFESLDELKIYFEDFGRDKIHSLAFTNHLPELPKNIFSKTSPAFIQPSMSSFLVVIIPIVLKER